MLLSNYRPEGYPNMTKILSVVHYYPPHVGGMEWVAKKIATDLVGENFESSVATAALEDAPRGCSTENGVLVYRCPAVNILDRKFGLPFPFFGFSLFATMRTQIRRADLVQLHDVFYIPSWVGYFFARRYKKPVVLAQHVAMVDHPSKAITGIQNMVYRIMGNRIFSYAKKIIVYNKNVYDFLVHRGVDVSKVVELRNGIDTHKFKPVSEEERLDSRAHFGLPLDRTLVLFVGRLVSKKGFDKVFAARGSEYDLVFVGPGEIPQQWKGELHVHWLGSRAESDLVKLYSACDLFCFPATGEILTLVMQEAMASGLPVITTNDPAYEKYNLNSELVCFVEPDVHRLKAAIVDVAKDKQLRENMSLYSRAYAEKHFDWKQNFGLMVGVYRSILGGFE